MEKNRFKCKRCGWETNNQEFFFCLRCGGDLGRGGIWVECCERLVVDPKNPRAWFLPFCPYCGKQTGQVSPEAQAARQLKREKEWEEEKEMRRRVLHPPPLSGTKVHLRKAEDGVLAGALLEDIHRNLDHLDNRLVVIVETPGEAQMLFEAFNSSQDCPAHLQPMLETFFPNERKVKDIAGRFSGSKIIFTTLAILKSLDLPYANRFFVQLKTVSDDSLKILKRFASCLNRSRDPVLFDYLIEGVSSQAREKLYRQSGATVLGN